NLKSKNATTVYYTDKTGRQIELLAVTPKYLLSERKEATEAPAEAMTYWATEKEVTKIPEGATVIK
ncbi:MAG: hypothetical protein K2Q34_05510, partial [Alphaproteobacteria bacterium]|nr:hypothetical protein [Alphaproteobacteria bacterium]